MTLNVYKLYTCSNAYADIKYKNMFYSGLFVYKKFLNDWNQQKVWSQFNKTKQYLLSGFYKITI